MFISLEKKWRFLYLVFCSCFFCSFPPSCVWNLHEINRTVQTEPGHFMRCSPVEWPAPPFGIWALTSYGRSQEMSAGRLEPHTTRVKHIYCHNVNLNQEHMNYCIHNHLFYYCVYWTSSHSIQSIKWLCISLKMPIQYTCTYSIVIQFYSYQWDRLECVCLSWSSQTTH